MKNYLKLAQKVVKTKVQLTPGSGPTDNNYSIKITSGKITTRHMQYATPKHQKFKQA